MGARNQVGIGLSYRPASLGGLATQFQTRFLESIPCPIAELKFSTLVMSLIPPSSPFICSCRLVACMLVSRGGGEGGGLQAVKGHKV
jgi:hypothetical protein